MKNLKAIAKDLEKGTVTEFYLIKDGENVGFNQLAEIVNNERLYINLNDSLADGDRDTFIKYNFGKLALVIEFVEE